MKIIKKWFNKINQQIKIYKERYRLLDIIYSNSSPLEKCLSLQNVVDYFPLKQPSYLDLKPYYLTVHINTMSALIDSLQKQYEYLYTNTPYCTQSNFTNTDLKTINLMDWTLDGIESKNYISFLIGWRRALWYIVEINKMINSPSHKTYVEGHILSELFTFIEITDFILEELIE